MTDIEFLSIKEIIVIMVSAFFVSWGINTIRKLRIIIRPVRGNTKVPIKDLQMILERCYSLFPMEMLNFNGQVFTRGMKIKLTTQQNKIFEGEFIGRNSNNMVCIVTSKLVVAHELRNIEKISIVDDDV